MVGFYASDMSMSVGAVAEELGISASTLRSWERRYGLGSTDRELGTRRQYKGTDIARLRRMIDLIHAGVPTKEAAAQVRDQTEEVLVRTQDHRLSVEEILSLARDGDATLPDLLAAEVRKDGLLPVYAHLVEPAIKELTACSIGTFPGRSPELSVMIAFVEVVRSIMEDVVFDHLKGRVTVVARPGGIVPATVTAAALALSDVDARVLTSPSYDEADILGVLERHVEQFNPRVIVIWGRFELGHELIDAFGQLEDLRFIQISQSLRDFVHPRLQRVRTISAAVEEAAVIVHGE